MSLTILVSVKLNLSVVLIYISLTSNVEHFSHGLVCMSYLEKVYSDLYPFLVGLFVFLLLHFNSSLYVFHIHLSDIIYLIFSLILCTVVSLS